MRQNQLNYFVTLFFIALLCIVTHSCTSKDYNNDPATNLDELKYTVRITDFKDSLSILYSDIFSAVKYIQFDASNEESTVGTISQLVITNNNDMIIFDRENNKIVRFDSCGHFINTIGERGHGPNEYIAAKSIAYDKYEDKLLVLDTGKKGILFYDLNGQVRKKINVFDISTFSVIDKDHLILYKNYIMKEPDYNYIIIDKKGEIKTQFEKITGPLQNIEYPSSEFVFNHIENDCLLCHSYYSSIVYIVKGLKVEPFLEIIPNDGNWSIAKSDMVNLANENRYNKFIHSTSYVNGKFLFEGYNIPQGHGIYYWTDLHGQVREGQKIINDLGGYVPFSYCLTNHGNDIFYCVLQNEYESLLNSWKDRKDIPQEDREYVTKMANSTNPIIQVCTVKD